MASESALKRKGVSVPCTTWVRLGDMVRGEISQPRKDTHHKLPPHEVPSSVRLRDSIARAPGAKEGGTGSECGRGKQFLSGRQKALEMNSGYPAVNILNYTPTMVKVVSAKLCVFY